jgi:protein TonB
MNYVTQSHRPNPVAVLGALGIPAGFGALLIVGLAVTAVIKPDVETGPIIDFPTPTPTPPPIEPKKIEKTQPSSSTITAPDNPFPINRPDVPIADPLPPMPPAPPGPTPGAGNGLGSGAGTPAKPTPTPTPKLFDPIAAKPRGNPGSWVTNNDYRSNWIRRGMSGSASFSLQISAAGKVTGCSIISSTGHEQLDQATCALIQKRAKFDPARDDRGNPTTGTYRNSITWRLPE